MEILLLWGLVRGRWVFGFRAELVLSRVCLRNPATVLQPDTRRGIASSCTVGLLL